MNGFLEQLGWMPGLVLWLVWLIWNRQLINWQRPTGYQLITDGYHVAGVHLAGVLVARTFDLPQLPVVPYSLTVYPPRQRHQRAAATAFPLMWSITGARFVSCPPNQTNERATDDFA